MAKQFRGNVPRQVLEKDLEFHRQQKNRKKKKARQAKDLAFLKTSARVVKVSKEDSRGRRVWVRMTTDEHLAELGIYSRATAESP